MLAFARALRSRARALVLTVPRAAALFFMGADQGATVAAFVTFAISKLVTFARRHYGQQQLARSAMLDARFLFT
jgi:hypothetical protein